MDESAGARFAGRLQAVVEAEQLSGCPVAGRDDATRQEMASLAMRRWRSFARRSVHPGQAAHAEQVEDLAKGLRDRFETNPALTGATDGGLSPSGSSACGGPL